MQNKNSYKIDLFQRAKQEMKILEIRSHARIESMIPQLTTLGLKPDMDVLEVGSGTGTRGMELARYLKKGSLVGIDVSDSLLSHARLRLTRSKIRNMKLEKMDLFKLKFKPRSFDFIYMRLVVQHLSQPVLALENLRSVLKPGGILFIEDTDRDWLTIYPALPKWEKIYEEVKNSQLVKGGDPRSGRKLATYLREAGYRSVDMNLVPVFGSGEIFEDWVNNYAPSFFNYFDKKAQNKNIRILDDLKRVNAKTPIYLHQVWFQSWGKK